MLDVGNRAHLSDLHSHLRISNDAFDGRNVRARSRGGIEVNEMQSAEPKIGKAAGEMSTLRAPYGCANCTSSVSADTGLQIERGDRDHEVTVEVDRPEKIDRSNQGGGQMRCGPLSL